MTNLTYPELAFYAANAKSFRNVIGVSKRNQAVFSEAAAGSAPESNPESINVAFATSNYFPEFGIAPALGRVLTPDDERPDAEPAAVIGELFWQRRLGGDPAVIGRSIRVNGKLLRVVGVMPRSAGPATTSGCRWSGSRMWSKAARCSPTGTRPSICMDVSGPGCLRRRRNRRRSPSPPACVSAGPTAS